VTTQRTQRIRLGWWHPAAAAYSLVAALTEPLTLIAAIAALIPGLALMGIRLTRPAGPLPPGARPGRAGAQWFTLLAAFGVWELVAALWGNDAEHPTLSLLLSPTFEHYPVRVVGYLGWLNLGRWLVNR
jgi:hypothetical protein